MKSSSMIFISQNNFKAKGIVSWQNNIKGNRNQSRVNKGGSN
jgi:hypothetical protein